MLASLQAKLIALGLTLFGLALGLWWVYDSGYDNGVANEKARWDKEVAEASAAIDKQILGREATSEAIGQRQADRVEQQWARVELEAVYRTEIIHEGFRAAPVADSCLLPDVVRGEFEGTAERINALSGQLRGEEPR